MNKEVFWERWKSPFLSNNDNEEDETNFAQEQKNAKILVSPFGILPLNDTTDISNSFNFWILHTNFTIGQKEFNIIEETPGVETLDLFALTRYRCRIGIGRVFDENEVKQDIEKRLGVEI